MSEYEKWEVIPCKGNQVKITCSDPDVIVNDQLKSISTSGLGLYGYQELKALAVAILMFEKEHKSVNSVLEQLVQEEQRVKEEQYENEWAGADDQ